MTVPKMHIMTTPRPPGIQDEHELKGWEDLDRWAMINHPLWRSIRERTLWETGMSEIDKLRLLAGEMLRLTVELQERNTQTLLHNAQPRN